jgi:hypothetical protein
MSTTTAMADAPSGVSRTATKWGTLPGGVVEGGEIIIFAIKPSMWRPVFDSAPWLVVALFLALALTVLAAPFPGLSLSLTAQVVILLGIARLGFAVVRWVPTWYVLTNRRIIDIRGVRAPRIWSCPLIDVRNTYVSAQFGEKLTRLGSISFVTDNADEPPRTWQSVAQPEEIHIRVRRAIESAIDEFGIS